MIPYTGQKYQTSKISFNFSLLYNFQDVKLLVVFLRSQAVFADTVKANLGLFNQAWKRAFKGFHLQVETLGIETFHVTASGAVEV